MFLVRPGCAAGCVTMLAVATWAGTAGAQTTASPTSAPTPVAQQTIGHLDVSATTEKVQVSGAVTLTADGTALGNGSTVTAGKVTLPIRLTRGGQLDLCATTTVHLSQQYNAADSNSPLMVALDHGAIEAHYKVGKNSDVVLTPDLRILLSGPGEADVRIRLNEAGDTCVANRGDNAPYVTVSEQMGPGVYRVMPNQRVMFEQGSVRNVVDNEAQPCGCPAPVISVASAGSTAVQGKAVAKPGEAGAAKPAEKSEPLGGPSSTPADTAFPLAESEGLAPQPAIPTKPVVPLGETHSEVTTTLSYIAPKQTVPTGAPSGMATPESAATVASAPVPGFGPSVNTGPVAVAEAPPVPQPKPHKSGFFHKLGRFFAKIFG
ncbi:MAG TPA: hypothetical protein VMF56_14340 [Acidobacteriaceae bacterium]|nr:hypothetical protein [Acidobacteriaceae bacterium]